MQMHLSSEPHIPDGMLAAIALRNEKPRLGVPSWNPALHQGIDASNSTIVLGLQSTAALNRIGSRCTGKERDAESGLDYFGARYYASNMGRWMSPDWADKPEAVPYSDLANPQSLNLYGYVNNNPLSKADPDGHCPPGQDCGKVTVTATTSGKAPLTTSNGGRTATVEGTVQYKFTYNGKPLTNTQIHEDISNKSSRDGVPEKAKLTTSDGPTGPANNNPPGTIPDTSSISITTPFGGAGATMETSVFSKDTTQTLSFQTPTGSACSVTETRTLSNADSKGQPTDTYNIKLTSPATQKATPVTPPKTPTT
jgi:RHS repeat-associated protein